MSDKRLCEECAEPIAGRSDKRFCSDLCRNAFNNKLNSDTNNFVRNINNILRKNRRILEENLKGDTSKISKQKLIDNNFNFNYFTNIHHTKNNTTYYYCYEYGYLYLENEYILIVKKKENN
ncbi:MAG: hypothetical protein JSU07_02325 [Bacteroidetes bacterium]|nr:hypothetical protein [Bacteroidota bacterium]